MNNEAKLEMGINIELAKQAVGLCAASYTHVKNAKRIRSWLTSANSYVLMAPGMQVVIYTGSNSFMDWVLNLMPSPVRYGKGYTPWGFAAAHKSLWRRIRAELDPDVTTYFIGHSLGGAMAEISTDFCDDFRGMGYITFGKPNCRLRGHYPSISHLIASLSVVNGCDIVASLPKYPFSSHPDQSMLYRDRHDKYHFNPSSWFRRFDRRIEGLLTNHFVAQYVEMMAEVTDIRDWRELPDAAANDPQDLEESA